MFIFMNSLWGNTENTVIVFNWKEAIFMEKRVNWAQISKFRLFWRCTELNYFLSDFDMFDMSISLNWLFNYYFHLCFS